MLKGAQRLALQATATSVTRTKQIEAMATQAVLHSQATLVSERVSLSSEGSVIDVSNGTTQQTHVRARLSFTDPSSVQSMSAFTVSIARLVRNRCSRHTGSKCFYVSRARARGQSRQISCSSSAVSLLFYSKAAGSTLGIFRADTCMQQC